MLPNVIKTIGIQFIISLAWLQGMFSQFGQVCIGSQEFAVYCNIM